MDGMKRFLSRIDDHLAMVTLVLIVIITIAGVFMRYVVGEPFSWVEEVSKGLVVWFTFLGASTVMRDDDHISIDFIVTRMPKRVQVGFDILRMTVMTVVLLFLVIWGGKLLVIAWFKITPTLHIRYTFIDIVVPIAAAAMVLHLFRAFHRRNSARGSSDDNGEES
jgi:TRAP-type transport system small permease protein